METINGQKEFDCLEMKREIQAEIYAEIKNMTSEERILYFHIPPEQTLSDDAKKQKTQWLLKFKIGVKMPAPNERFDAKKYEK